MHERSDYKLCCSLHMHEWLYHAMHDPCRSTALLGGNAPDAGSTVPPRGTCTTAGPAVLATDQCMSS